MSRHSFNDVTRINFSFRLLVTCHLRMAVMHYPVKVDTYIFIQFGVIDIFPKFKMATAAHLDFLVMWIWPFRRVDSVVFELCAKFDSNICYGYWNRRTYASGVHLMTSRELTTGFHFWSCGHLRMAVLHLPIKFGADIFIQSGVIDIFQNSRWRPPSWIFSSDVNRTSASVVIAMKFTVDNKRLIKWMWTKKIT